MLETMFALLNRYEQQFVVVILDIDHFKKVNDAQGHLQGDRTLQNVARLIDETVRDTDMVARYGGEEFVVVMPHTDANGACIFADSVRAKIASMLDVTISGGVAVAVRRRQPAIATHPCRCRALRDKAAGRNRIFQHTGVDMVPAQELNSRCRVWARSDASPAPAARRSIGRFLPLAHFKMLTFWDRGPLRRPRPAPARPASNR